MVRSCLSQSIKATSDIDSNPLPFHDIKILAKASQVLCLPVQVIGVSIAPSAVLGLSFTKLQSIPDLSLFDRMQTLRT